jgi:hypothetical protein
MKFTQLAWCGAALLTAVVLVGCSGDKKVNVSAQQGPGQAMKDAPKDFHPPSGIGTTGVPDKDKMASSLGRKNR